MEVAVREVTVSEGGAKSRAFSEEALLTATQSLCKHCSMVLVLAPAAASAASASAASASADGGVCAALSALQPSREVPALGSLMRGACLSHAPAAALLGSWGVAVYDQSLVMRLPGNAEAAVACVRAVLPATGHAVAQAGNKTPPQVRR